MAFKILQKGREQIAVYQGSCFYCKCVFEFNREDIKSQFYVQTKGYDVLYLECPHCKRSIGIEEHIVRYEEH